MTTDVRLKRAYEPPAATDGYRVLIDRLWPRGVKRDRARLDEWAQELASRSFVAVTRLNWRGKRRSYANCGVGRDTGR